MIFESLYHKPVKHTWHCMFSSNTAPRIPSQDILLNIFNLGGWGNKMKWNKKINKWTILAAPGRIVTEVQHGIWALT